MKKILSRGLMLAVVGMSALGAYEYTSIQRVEDIYPLYPKTLEEVQQRAEVTEKKFHQSVEAFLKSRLSASALLRRWDELEAAMGASMNIFSTIALVEPDDKLRQACDAAYQKLQQKWITTLSERVELYRKLDKAYQKEGKRLQEDEKYYLQQILQEMRLEGMHLPEKQREQVKALKIELSKLSESFSKNIQEDKSCIKVAKEGLEGVAGDFQAQLKEDAEGYKIVTCDYPVYFKVMKSCLSSDTRRALYRAFMNRAYPQNDTVLQAIIAKRDELAHLLGFDSFAALQLSQEMVQRPQRAEAFLRELSEKFAAKGDQELQSVTTVLENVPLTKEGKLQPWDVAYFEEKYRQARYDLDDELIRAYFPMETTLQGLMSILEKFFDLKVEELPIKGLWHEDVKLVKIADRGSSHVYGYILMDLFPRANKYSHACHSTMLPSLYFAEDTQTTGLSLLVANFPKSTEEKPSLLTLSDVRTFFHEFGHGIHAILGRTRFAGTAGTRTKVDFVELPSQMLEEWLWDAEILKLISCHYQTKEKLPQEVISKILETKTAAAGFFVERQCLLSKFALACFSPGVKKDTSELFERLHQGTPLGYAYDKESHFEASFGHLDGYGARYYGYLWSRVFALDVFEQIKKEGLLNPLAGKRYVKEILSKGGSDDPAVLLKNYLGREPSQEAFLKAYGL